MTKERFFENMLAEEYPKAGWFRRWWERRKMEVWLKLPNGYKSTDTNLDFINQIPDEE